jgi:hypothetical protein
VVFSVDLAISRCTNVRSSYENRQGHG